METKNYTGIIGNTVIDVYDNGGETFDRYTIVIDEDYENCIGMSSNPNHPQGFNQYVGRVEKSFLDTETHLASIPTCILPAIIARI